MHSQNFPRPLPQTPPWPPLKARACTCCSFLPADVRPSNVIPQLAFFVAAATAGARVVATDGPFCAPFWGLRAPRDFTRLCGVLRALHSAPAARAPASGATQ